jgi:hypothetical protein
VVAAEDQKQTVFVLEHLVDLVAAVFAIMMAQLVLEQRDKVLMEEQIKMMALLNTLVVVAVALAQLV